MRNFYLLITFSLALVTANAQVNIQWESRYTSTGSNDDAAADLVVDASGNVYVTGTIMGTNGNFDYLTVKYDNLGNQLWSTSYNGTGNGLDEARSIGIDQDGNVYVTGYSEGAGGNFDIVTIKYHNSTGAQGWINRYDGPNGAFDEAYKLAVDTTNLAVYITGGSDGGASNTDITTIKYDTAGSQNWVRRHDGPNNGIDNGYDIAVDNSGNVYVTGNQDAGSSNSFDFVTLKYNSAGTQQWSPIPSYNGPGNLFDVANSITVDASGNAYITGYSYGGFQTENDWTTIKYNSTGAQQWAKRYDGPDSEDDIPNDIKVDLLGNVYVAGRSRGTGTGEDFTTIKYDNSGNLSWKKRFDGPASAYDEATSLFLDEGSGNLYVTGYSASVSASNDYLTIKYDISTGNRLWKTRFDGPNGDADQAVAIDVDAIGNVYVTGKSKGSSTGQDYSTIKYCQFTANAGADLEICFGDSAQLNATNGTAFSWSPSQGLSDTTIANPYAYPTTTTDYVVTSTNANGCVDSDTVKVIVNSLPSATIDTSGPTSFCMGDSVILSTDTAASYQWNTGSMNDSITVFSSGTYTLSITDSNNCESGASISVNVFSLPNVDAGLDTAVCSNDSVMLNATGASSYTWNTSTGLSDSTIANPYAAPNDTANFYVSGTDNNGCVNTDTVTVDVVPSPAAAFVKSADTIYLNVSTGNVGFIETNSSSYNSRIWYFGDGDSSLIKNPNHTYTYPDTFIITFVGIKGFCTDTVRDTLYVYKTNSITENSTNLSNLKLFPNPNNGNFTLSFRAEENQKYNISLLNTTGQTVRSETKFLVKGGRYRKRFSMGDLPKGLYFVSINGESDGKVSYKKVVLH